MATTIGARIKGLREAKGWTQDDLAEHAGMNRVTIAKYEIGTIEPKSNSLSKLAKAFGISADLLLGEKPNGDAQAVRVPVLGTIPAGVPIEAIEDILDWEEIPASMANGGKEYFALQIHGDSMTPTYQDGDVVIIRRQDTCESGQDCAVIVNGSDSTFKRVRRSLDGIVLQPLNSAYTPLVYTNAQIEALPVRILGVAVEIRRKLI